MYSPTTRLLTILELLQARQQLSGAELAARLEVDRRTVRRYITMLHDLGIPIEATPGRYGGYRLRPGYKIPPLIFNEDEAAALVIGLLAARRIGLANATPAVEGALAKIERVLPPAVRERVTHLDEAVALDLAPAVRAAPSPLIATLGSAAIRPASTTALPHPRTGRVGAPIRSVWRRLPRGRLVCGRLLPSAR